MNSEITIEKTSAKGAMLITDGERSCWIMPKQKRADGTFTPGAYSALEKAETKKDFTDRKAAERKEAEMKRTINGNRFNVWTPSDDYARLYFADQSFISLSTKERAPQGYYESHRYCKGEDVTITFVKAEGNLATELISQLLYSNISDLLPSGQNKIMLNINNEWKEIN
ncbi:MAG TPA: hypothetical protein VJ455_04400 [Ignavibacteria bacterium]|nr:hypothetical protein [Ignavibacteria bacterium]